MANKIAMPTTALVPREAQAAFLELTPPHWAARGLAYAIILVVALGALAAVAIKMPETVTAQFVLVPVRGTDPVKASRSGIVAQVFANEGQPVKQGDVLAVLRSEAVGDRAADLQTLQTQLAGAGDSFTNTRLKFETERLAEAQEIVKLTSRVEHLDSLIAHKRQQFRLTKQMADSYEQLLREGIASQAQLSAKQIEVSEITAEVERLVAEQLEARQTIDKLRLAANARQTEFRETERKFKEELKTNEIRANALQAGLAGSDGNEVKLTAPCAGTLLKLNVKGSGAVLHEGETVAEMVCAGEPLQAELTVPEAGLGKLKLEQGVKLKYDAFPYQRYGVKYGRITWLSPASVEQGAKPAFKARVELTEAEVNVQGRTRQLAPGMSGQADIVVGKRSLLSYVFEPLRQLKENMADVPEQVSKR